MRRSGRVGSYRGRWSAISGYLEDPTPLAQARREIREETGLSEQAVHLVRAGAPLEADSPLADGGLINKAGVRLAGEEGG